MKDQLQKQLDHNLKNIKSICEEHPDKVGVVIFAAVSDGDGIDESIGCVSTLGDLEHVHASMINGLTHLIVNNKPMMERVMVNLNTVLQEIQKNNEEG